MTLDELIEYLKKEKFQVQSLESACYFFINKNHTEINKNDFSEFEGEIESNALKSFCDEFAEIEELIKIKIKIEKKIYRGLSVYHYIGLYQQDILNDSEIFKKLIYEFFETHSIRNQYVITKVFKEFEEKFKISLRTDSNDNFVKSLKHIYLEESIDKTKIITSFIREKENLDLIDLLLFEDLMNIKSIGYNREQEKLLVDIIWCATEIQSKHKVLNNNEDQYNSNFQSFLKAKNYKTEPQTQRGQSFTSTQYGELDIAIFNDKNLPLSIFEAFVVDSIKKDYISMHLKKLSESYDPNGLKNNYAIVYAKQNKFEDFWARYIDFIPKIDFTYPIINEEIRDITSQYSIFSGIKIGLTKHLNRGNSVNIYHIFMDMNFE